VHLVIPAPPADDPVEPSPLNLDVWVCPDRDQALALYWLRTYGSTINPFDPASIDEGLGRITHPEPSPDDPILPRPCEAAQWINPRIAISVLLTKYDQPVPLDRLVCLRGNVVIEASTVEFTRSDPGEPGKAWPLRQAVPDVIAILRAFDTTLTGPGVPR
jgi:hypothetical protein